MINFLERYEAIRTTKKETTCIADRILNYLQFLIKIFNLEDNRNHIVDCCIHLYKELRVEGCFIDKNPRSMALGLLYCGALLTGNNLTYESIAYSTNSGRGTVLRASHIIQSYLEEFNIKNIYHNESLNEE